MSKTAAEEILEAPINEWPQAIQKTKQNLQIVEAELSALIQRAVLLHAYLQDRFNTGCGVKDHEPSAKKANKELVRVRLAMGFSYPKQTGGLKL